VRSAASRGDRRGTDRATQRGSAAGTPRDIVEVRSSFGAVSVLYDDFREVADDTVRAALAAAQT
jgi:predicted phosphoribosyltransferase